MTSIRSHLRGTFPAPKRQPQPSWLGGMLLVCVYDAIENPSAGDEGTEQE